jgi:1-acyl-sn-glycerol-3-phosphate acyltransferase
MLQPPRPRELPLAIVCLFAAILYVIVWPIVILPPPGSKTPPNFEPMAWFLAGLPALLLGLYPAVGYRALGHVGYAGAAILTGLLISWNSGNWTCRWLALLQGIGCWTIIGSSVRYLCSLSRSVHRLSVHRLVFQRSRNRTVFIAGTAMMFVTTASLVIQTGSREVYRPIAEAKLFAIAFLLAFLGWTLLFRALFEVTLEWFVWVMYPIRGAGPGRVNLPPFGSCVIVANHAAWLDPLFIQKVIPRPVTAIMTERFYKMKLLNPLLKYAFRVIVVPEASLRREAPEIQQAVAALDRGDCVLMFPEGFLRRKEEVPLRRFGQGIWHLLSARPETPVVACWIEGSWGSLCSFAGGPPLKNKTFDFFRKVGVGVASAQPVPKELLQEHLRTRIFLMNRVSAARAHLGLAPLPIFEQPPREAEEEPTPGE